jgi:hypothetical protein
MLCLANDVYTEIYRTAFIFEDIVEFNTILYDLG